MEIISAPSFSEKNRLLKSFDPQKQTWIVSDLQSKWELQKKFLNHHTVLDENSILRASEFWTKILFRLEPSTKVVSTELLDQWIWSWLKTHPNTWSRVPDSARSVRLHLEFFAPIFSQIGFESLMEEWFEKNSDSVIRWRHIYEVCRRIWKDLEQEKLLTVGLIPSRLLDLDLRDHLWDQELIFDLGPEARAVEKKLALNLSESLSIRWIETEVPVSNFKLQGELKRLPTQLGEVKETVAQVRKWLDQGVLPSQIAIFAPDIEKFWPAFHQFLKVEGIGAQKPLVRKFVDDPKIQSWLSRLRVELGRFSKGDLESFYFQQITTPAMGGEDFRYYFSTLTDPEQASRMPDWKKTSRSSDKPVHLLQFMEWALRLWPEHFGAESLDRIWKILARDHFEEFKMNLEEWFLYCEQRLSKAEQILEEEFESGIHLFSFSSGEWVDVSHVVTLGLSEQDLRKPSELIVSPFETDRLKQDLGFEIEHDAHEHTEAHWIWLLSKNLKSQLHLSSGVDFMGDEITPSKYWLRSAFEQDPERVQKAQAPSPLVWDQRAAAFQIPEFFEGESNLAPEKLSVSASSLKLYFDCPFKFFAEKLLKLSDQPVLDFDLDPMTKGQLMHALFERLIQDWGAKKWSLSEIEQLIEELRQERHIQIGDERIWPAMRGELVKLSLIFLEMEGDWRSRLPQLQTVAQEVSFVYGFEPSSQKIQEYIENSNLVKVTGRIDRVDLDEHGQAAIIDYKSSSSKLTGWMSWRKNGDYQMVLYTLALESGLSDLKEAHNVQTAYYHVPKNGERSRGFFMRAEEPTLFADLSLRSQSWLNEEKKQQLIQQSLEDLGHTVERIRSGDFFPKPNDVKICERCRWSKLCRAPHLI